MCIYGLTFSVLVYDYTSKTKFNLNMDLNPALHDALHYNHDIPSGSLALVAYTVNMFERKDGSKNNLGFNIHWAVLLGTL